MQKLPSIFKGLLIQNIEHKTFYFSENIPNIFSLEQTTPFTALEVCNKIIK